LRGFLARKRKRGSVSAATGIRRFGLAVIALVVAGFGVLLALSLVIPADSVRDAVKQQIRTITGLDPVFSGDVVVSLFPTGRARFYDVSLGDNRTGASALTAEQLLVRLRFFPFLMGRIEIADVMLVRPSIRISYAPNGSSNWAPHIEALARNLQPSPERVSSFSEIRISDGTVILSDETRGLSETLSGIEFALAWPSISKTFGATGQLTWHDEKLNAAFSLSDFVAALNGARSGLKVRVAGAPMKLAFDGYISYRPTLRMEGMLSTDAPSLRDTLQWAAGWEAPAGGFGSFALKAQTSVNGGTVALSGVNVELDGNVGEGVLQVAGDARKTVQGTLAADGLNLTPYAASMREFTGGGGDRNWNQRPIAVNGLNGVDVDLRLSAARVTMANVKLGRTAVTANVRSGSLTLAIGESQVFGGMAAGSIGFANAASGVDLKVSLQFSDVDLDQCLGEMFGVRRVEGKGNLSFAFDSSGGSVFELARSMNGSANLSSRKGAIAGFSLEQLLRQLERSPLSSRGDYRGGKTPFDLLALNVKVVQGMAQLDDVRIEAPSVRIMLGGTASVPGRDLDLKGTATLLTGAANDSPAAFELPFVVQGSWSDPVILPDAQLLIRRSGAAAPLLDAVRNRLRRERPQIDAPATTSAVPLAPAQPTLSGTSAPPQ
jgi:AsmA protein